MYKKVVPLFVCNTYSFLGKAWITPEKRAVQLAFWKHIDEQRLPSYRECRDAISMYSPLKDRTPPIIKAHVSNEINRRKRQTFKKFI